MPARTLEKALDELAALRVAGDAPELRAKLSRALAGRQNLLVAKAAKIISELRLEDFCTALAEAFDRFMIDPATTDKGCAAKLAIAEALYELECDADRVLLAGLKHVQLEPVWGGRADTAALLRGTCALALVRGRHPQILPDLVDLLMDPQPQARILAARALAGTGRPEAALLLRLKLLAGDPEADVTAECFGTLVALEEEASLDFVARFLDATDGDVFQAAALALGQSRQERALEMLRACWSGPAGAERRRMLLLPIALVRRPAAIEFLLKVVEKETGTLAAATVDALEMYRSDEAVRAQIEEAARRRGDERVRRAFEASFRAPE